MKGEKIGIDIDLDDPATFGQLDRRDMVGLASQFPQQCQHAIELGDRFQLPPDLRNPQQLVFAGLGGSGLGGELVARLFERELPIPAMVSQRYQPPGFLNSDSLLFCISYSGNTEEAISTFQAGMDKGARIICLTSGGRLGELAAAHQVPLVLVPNGRPPRSAFGYLFLPMIRILEKLGLIGDQTQVLHEAVERLTELEGEIGPQVPTSANQAKELALKLQGRFPVIYGCVGPMGVVAYRWRTQLNENSKVLACSHVFTELDHNEIVGWGEGAQVAGDPMVIILRSQLDNDRAQLQMEVAKKIISSQAEVYEICGQGKWELAQALGLLYLGDFTSIYLALLRGVDPSQIAAIDRLKGELSQRPR